MKKFLITSCFVLLIIASKAQVIETPKAFKLPDLNFKFDTLTKKFKADKPSIFLNPQLQTFLKNNGNKSYSDGFCFYPDITQVVPMPNASKVFGSLIPVRIPNMQAIPFNKEDITP